MDGLGGRFLVHLLEVSDVRLGAEALLERVLAIVVEERGDLRVRVVEVAEYESIGGACLGACRLEGVDGEPGSTVLKIARPRIS